MTEPRFRTDVFLLRTLVGIFVVQAIFLLLAWLKCTEYVDALIENGTFHKGMHPCPDLAGKTEQLLTVAVATVLSLMSTKK